MNPAKVRTGSKKIVSPVWTEKFIDAICKLGPLSVVCILALSCLFAIAAFPRLVTHLDPLHQDLRQSLNSPSRDHLLGTDYLGRDVLTRVVHGTRPSLFLAMGGTVMGAFVGILLGVLAGFYGRAVEQVILRMNDLVLAVPGMIIALVIIALVGPGVVPLLIALTVLSVSPFVRIAHATTTEVRESMYIAAARALGVPDRGLMLRHVLPNIASPILTLIPITAGTCLLVGSSLSFLGLGIQPPTPELGLLVSEGRAYVWEQPYLAIAPGCAVILICLSFNFLGQGLRDIFTRQHSEL